MQVDRTPIVPRPDGRARGLGNCDVLTVELDSSQIEGLLEELDELREAAYERLNEAQRGVDALRPLDAALPSTEHFRAAEEELSACEYALEVHARLTAQVPPSDQGQTMALTGPASMVSGLVGSAAQHTVEALAELVREPPGADEEPRKRLSVAAAAASAWIETYLDCQHVEWFNFDAACDPFAGLQ